jgi:Calcineurin-like phosphoesterase
LLNRQFVLEQMESLTLQLREDVRQERRGGRDTEELEPADYRQALTHLTEALTKEQALSSGQPGYDIASDRRDGEGEAMLDDFSFFSRDPTVSIVQSALEYSYTHTDSRVQVVRQELSDDRRGGADDYPVISDLGLKDFLPRRGADNRRVFDRFSETDIGWVNSLVAMGVRKLRKRRAFNPMPPKPVELSERVRLVLVGDWGSGIPRAQKVGTAMRMIVQQSIADNQDVHVIHLGDVYYSGWDYEYKDRFLPYWPVKPNETGKAGSWCLNGNHDMYSGGFAYFDTLLKDPRFQSQGQASFFRLYNANWQLFGLDTAWEDNGLKDPQASWVLNELATNGQKAILLTHHQLFSAYEDGPEVGRVMRETLGSALVANRIHAAFWGHEHRCVIYDPAQHVKYGRLIGHGGVPVYMTHTKDDPYPAPANYEYRRYIGKGLEHWALFGFAVLDFNGPTIDVKYFDEDGDNFKQETIV